MNLSPQDGLSPVAKQIMAYLGTHRDAQDTLQGIAEWWLLEQRIGAVITETRNALAELVDRGLLIERNERDGGVRYLLHPEQRIIVKEKVPHGKSTVKKEMKISRKRDK